VPDEKLRAIVRDLMFSEDPECPFEALVEVAERRRELVDPRDRVDLVRPEQRRGWGRLECQQRQDGRRGGGRLASALHGRAGGADPEGGMKTLALKRKPGGLTPEGCSVCDVARCHEPATITDATRVVWPREVELCDRHFAQRNATVENNFLDKRTGK